MVSRQELHKHPMSNDNNILSILIVELLRPFLKESRHSNHSVAYITVVWTVATSLRRPRLIQAVELQMRESLLQIFQRRTGIARQITPLLQKYRLSSMSENPASVVWIARRSGEQKMIATFFEASGIVCDNCRACSNPSAVKGGSSCEKSLETLCSDSAWRTM
jgi:hypothetical protein